MSGESDLQRMIESLQELGTLNTTAAPDCATAIHEVLAENDRNHVDPYGVPWPVRKEDGEPALDRAEKVLFCAAVGARVVIRIKGPYARHHLGLGKSRVARKQIPDQAKLPDNINRAITDVLSRHFNNATVKT